MNTSEKGDRLRDDVYALLKAAGKEAVEKEKYLAGKKCDVYYEDRSILPGKVHRFAIECKAYGSPIDRSLYDKIKGEYSDGVKTRLDHLIIVTTHGVTSSTQDSIDATDWMGHEQYRDFCDRLLDFGRYLEALKGFFTEDGLDQYYEPVLDLEGRSIEQRVADWIEGDCDRPRAILAGYGMGKTSFSRRLAHRYADACIRGDSFRVPVYIRLGDILAEQTVEGLICKHFTQENVIAGFSYPLFRSFNRRGRFLIILDGFDEMKHAMTFEAFEFNIAQLRSLVEPGARVLILGRPNVFRSEDEKASVLHGVEKMGEMRIEDAAVPDFEGIEVDVFNSDQLERFVTRYIRYAAETRRRNRGTPYDEPTIEGRIQEILDPRYRDLISRPVHARMMITIALSTDEPLEGFSRYVLYEKFFELILRRERNKLARQGIRGEDRIRFARAVAWKAWAGGESGAITAGTLRKALREIGAAHTDDAQFREFVIGSVLERKPPDGYYFAHRSFIEFLCAQYLTETAMNPVRLLEFSDHVDKEILGFIRESGRAHRFAESVMDVLSAHAGRMRLPVLDFLAETAQIDLAGGLAGASAFSGPGPVLVYVLALGDFDLDRIERELYEAFVSMASVAQRLALVIGVCRRLRSCDDAKARSDIAAALAGVLHLGAFEVMIRHGQASGGTAAGTEGLVWTRLLIESVDAPFANRELRTMSLRPDELLASATTALASWFVLEEASIDALEPIDIPRPGWMRTLWLSSTAGADADAKERRREESFVVDRFWRSRPELGNFVPISTRSEPEPNRTNARTLSLPRT